MTCLGAWFSFRRVIVAVMCFKKSLLMVWAALGRRVPRELHCFSNGELVNTEGGVANIKADEPPRNLS